MRLPMELADPEWCITTPTDARKFYYNPEYVDALNLNETEFMLAHEKPSEGDSSQLETDENTGGRSAPLPLTPMSRRRSASSGNSA